MYALIACSLNKEWDMLVSDINDENIEWANKNISQNNLNEKITGNLFRRILDYITS